MVTSIILLFAFQANITKMQTYQVTPITYLFVRGNVLIRFVKNVTKLFYVFPVRI